MYKGKFLAIDEDGYYKLLQSMMEMKDSGLYRVFTETFQSKRSS